MEKPRGEDNDKVQVELKLELDFKLMPKGKLIVVDAFNFLGVFVPFRSNKWPSILSLLSEARVRISEFKEALKRSGYWAVFVFDNGQHSSDTRAKWVRRRLREVENEDYPVPASSSTFLRQFLKDAGFNVYRPQGIDGDDVVGKMASEYDGLILSEDKDMLRYGLGPARVFRTFAILEDGTLKLFKKSYGGYLEPKDLKSIPFPEDIALWEDIPIQQNVDEHTYQKFGNCDNFTKRFGNMFKISQPLRAALYNRLGIAQITEHMPIWYNNRAVIEIMITKASSELDHLLDDPEGMFQWIQARCGAPEERIHSSASIASKIYCTVDPTERSFVKTYETINTIPDSPRSPELAPLWASEPLMCRRL